VIRGSDGWFRFVDRTKDVIRRRGENISATEVESVLSQHPAVVQVAVVPVPSTLAEDEVMAAVVPWDGITLDPADLLRFAEQNLAYFALPATSTGWRSSRSPRRGRYGSRNCASAVFGRTPEMPSGRGSDRCEIDDLSAGAIVRTC
jgi:hypothetical protein